MCSEFKKNLMERFPDFAAERLSFRADFYWTCGELISLSKLHWNYLLSAFEEFQILSSRSKLSQILGNKIYRKAKYSLGGKCGIIVSYQDIISSR